MDDENSNSSNSSPDPDKHEQQIAKLFSMEQFELVEKIASDIGCTGLVEYVVSSLRATIFCTETPPTTYIAVFARARD